MGSDHYRLAREKMVRQQIEARGVRDRAVIDAMLKVPRHIFVDEALLSSAYGDSPLPIGKNQTISQPYIVALMTEALGLEGGEKCLEIGTGCGYQTAILAEIAGKVFSVERIPWLLSKARRNLDALGYHNVVLKLDDGTWGSAQEAPFDAIIVTAAAPEIPPPLLDQMADPGVMVIPVGDSYSQTLVKIVKQGGETTRYNLTQVRFVKLVGDHGWKA
jgi:protein-L-isoaspartate(D-aspartate) O-methyltransferase